MGTQGKRNGVIKDKGIEIIDAFLYVAVFNGFLNSPFLPTIHIVGYKYLAVFNG